MFHEMRSPCFSPCDFSGQKGFMFPWQICVVVSVLILSLLFLHHFHPCKICLSLYSQHLFNEWTSFHRAEFSNKFIICFTSTRSFTKVGAASFEVRVMKRRPWNDSLFLKATARIMDCSEGLSRSHLEFMDITEPTFLGFKNYIGFPCLVSRRFEASVNAYWVQLDRGLQRTEHVQERKQRWVFLFSLLFSKMLLFCCLKSITGKKNFFPFLVSQRL